MSGGKITVALLTLWVGGGLAFEATAHIDREVSRAEARAAAPRAIAERNLAQAHRFIAACLNGEPAPLGDELLYACQVRRMQLQQRHVRDELAALRSAD